MSLSLVFLLIGASLVVGASVALHEGESMAVRVISAAALTLGSLMFLIGFVNTLSGTT